MIQIEEIDFISTSPKMLWVVMIDTNCGCSSPDWVENSEPKQLQEALDESEELRQAGWITRMEPKS